MSGLLKVWSLPAPPKYPLIEPLWSLIVGIWGISEGTWGLGTQRLQNPLIKESTINHIRVPMVV